MFAIDEEAVDQNASTAMAPSAFAEDDDEDDDGFDSAVSSEMTSAWSSSDQAATNAERAGPAMRMCVDADSEGLGRSEKIAIAITLIIVALLICLFLYAGWPSD